MEINKNIREYITPLQRKNVKFCSTSIYSKLNFYNVLFDNEGITNVTERIFLQSQNTQIVSVIKSLIPSIYITNAIEGAENVELSIDVFFDIYEIEKEILLTYPTDEEVEILKLSNPGQVMVQKTYLFDDKKRIIRYEEEISDFDTYIFWE